MWPFKRKPPEVLSAEQLRDRLIAAAWSKRKLRVLCTQYRDQIVENVEILRKSPDNFNPTPAAVNEYGQRLGTVAEYLATECNAPELWNALCGTQEDNPLLQWEKWYEELPQRMEQLEYRQLIDEAREFIARAQTLEGHAVRRNEELLHGRLGELLFHSGHAADAVEAFRTALEHCRENGDVEGILMNLGNLHEVYRYLNDVSGAIAAGEEAIKVRDEHDIDATDLRKHIDRFREGEPLCRIVCVHDDQEYELDELPDIRDGRYEFQFCRNRMSLQMVNTLVQQGNRLASEGQLADGLEKYQEASEVDPNDPAPWYQRGMALLELGAYGKGREAFEEVERLAPGWFQCRSDIWLARSLEDGTVSDEEFRLLRMLEDGGLDPSEAEPIAEKAVEEYPEFAPFHLTLGDLRRNRKDREGAIACYRMGLKLVEEPDLESRLLCSLAGILPEDSPERKELIERALDLEGNLVAQATAKLLGPR